VILCFGAPAKCPYFGVGMFVCRKTPTYDEHSPNRNEICLAVEALMLSSSG
jgi:hypothetical protein